MSKIEQGDWEPFFDGARGMKYKTLTDLEHILEIFKKLNIKYKLDTTGENVNYLIIEDCQLVFSKGIDKYIGTL